VTTPGAPHATLDTVNTAAVIGNAMTDYLLASGTNKAPATRAPAHMAGWLESHGYQLVRSPARQADPGDLDLVARIAAMIDGQPVHDHGDKCALVRQVLTLLAPGGLLTLDARRPA
jgi:hypothetical protein